MQLKKLLTLRKSQKEFIDRHYYMTGDKPCDFILRAIDDRIEKLKKQNPKIYKDDFSK